MSVPDLPPPLGATPDDRGVTFAVYAGRARRVELCLFDPGDAQGRTERRVPLTDRIHGVWFAHLPGVRAGQRYGYRVHGPWRPEHGLRHNGAKLLLDPYGKAVEGEIGWAPEVFGHVVDAAFAGDSSVRDDRDSAACMPRSVVVDDAFDWHGDLPGRRAWADTVVYEAHPKGATAAHPQVPERLRGTYAGIAHPAFLDHLRRIGVTTLELLPVHCATDEVHLARQDRTNYWGYNTLGFFAPQARYAAASDPQGVVEEVKSMVRACHDADLEVILDVVYNHTAEQSGSGATLSWRGLDNASYYRLDERGLDIDVTGCGNTVDLNDPTALRMVLDSLRYWVTAFHVDGFRFDLAVALARGRRHGFDRDHPFLMALRTDPVLSRVKLVAEPWDVGLHGWRTGRFPPPFAEWNDRFRDTVRSYWLPDVASSGHGANGHGVRDLATRIAGSQDLFDGEDRGPLASVNYVASHDGFSLADTTAYDHKHNEANGEANRDGHGDNRSWNHGVEGPTDTPVVLAARRRSMRNLLATTILSTGVPMLAAGDEFGRTQRGNNNAYCQDNDVSWLDWDHAPWQEDLVETTSFLTTLRASHRVFRQGTFFTSYPRPGDGRADVLWYGRLGRPMTADAWEDPCCRILQVLLLGEDLRAQSLLLVLQGKNAPTKVTLPPLDNPDRAYELLWDSTWERPAQCGGDVEPGRVVALGPSCLQVYRIV